MSTISTIKMTARQFLQLGEDPPGVRLELVDGEVAVSPSPSPSHSYADRQLGRIVGDYIDAHDLGQLFGDVDTIFGDNDVRRPDLLFFSKKRLHLIGEHAMEGPPDLCVEVISPSSGTIDRVDKYNQYEAGGVVNYWVIEPEKKHIDAYQLRGKKYVHVGAGEGEQVVAFPPFKELSIPLGKLWLNLPPRKGRAVRR